MSLALLVLINLVGSGAFALAAASPPTKVLPGHTLPGSVTQGASPVQSHVGGSLALAVRLPIQNEDRLDALIAGLYTPGDPLYQNYLSADQFADQFGASQASVDHVTGYFQALGCSTALVHPNRLLIDLVCPEAAVESALKIKISHWVTSKGEALQTIDQDPTVPADLPVQAVHGLASEPRRPHFVQFDPSQAPVGQPLTGSGPNGGLSPSDIKTAYNLNIVTQTGAGQTLGLFELDGYQASDISAYQAGFGLTPSVPLQNVLIDGFAGGAGSGAVEVCLDIELMMAIAPGASRIIVYEGPNSEAGLIDVYQRIATDNLAKQISSSWGIPEGEAAVATLNSENQIFKQMAAQGQSIFAASGDHGANDNGQSLSVDDPASQPYITGTGGTTLLTNADHTYLKETAWWNSTYGEGGGGGVSSLWSIPSWQTGAPASGSLGSSSARNVPDVSLNADPASGYAVYTGGQWAVYGGTSAAAPLWAAFTALTNQKRLSGGLPVLGFANPALYQLGKSVDFNLDFHDVADNSTNGHYPSVTGFDLATGWGTLMGAGLLTDLASANPPAPAPTPTPSPTPTPPPPTSGPGCGLPKHRSGGPASGPESTGAKMSYGLPFLAAYWVRRKSKPKG